MTRRADPELAPGARALRESRRRDPLQLARGVPRLQALGRVPLVARPYPHYDADPFIEAAIEAFTLENCVWGSDWPFVRIDARMDYGPALSVLGRWLPDAADRNKVLWETPARLFGFS